MEQNSLPTISIGIPAHNEAGNIAFLLKALIKQRCQRATISQTIIVVDGSTDATVQIIRDFKDSRINLTIFKERRGLIAAQNKIIEQTDGDMLILFDADVIPASTSFTDELVMPLLLDQGVGLVGARVLPASPNSFFEKIIAHSHHLKTDIYRQLNKTSNIYLCHGRARAFSKKLYRQIIWPSTIAEDAYSYLFCIKQDLKFTYTDKASVYFRSPTNFNDHLKQSLRFINSKQVIRKYFESALVRTEYHIPLGLTVKYVFYHIVKSPILTTLYVTLFISSYIASHLKPQTSQSLFETSISSKKVL